MPITQLAPRQSRTLPRHGTLHQGRRSRQNHCRGSPIRHHNPLLIRRAHSLGTPGLHDIHVRVSRSDNRGRIRSADRLDERQPLRGKLLVPARAKHEVGELARVRARRRVYDRICSGTSFARLLSVETTAASESEKPGRILESQALLDCETNNNEQSTDDDSEQLLYASIKSGYGYRARVYIGAR